MASIIDSASLFLFVPADRPERFIKATAAGADAVIIDIEDAVAPAAKDAARNGLAVGLAAVLSDIPIYIRINGRHTPWHDEDLAVAAGLPIAGVMLPKAEAADDCAAVRAKLGPAGSLIALVETARGLAAVDAIARASDRLAFGSVDFAADLGCAHDRDALLLARSRIVLAARLAARPSPIDGVTLSIRDHQAVEADAAHAAALGFGGKLLIHPAQVAPASRGLAPGSDDVAWAERILGTTAGEAARAVDGMMVDPPVLARARHILRSRDRLSNG